MEKNIATLLPLMPVTLSCKKSANPTSTPATGNPDHSLAAVVSIKGSPAAFFITSENTIGFSKGTDHNGNVHISIVGANVSGQIHITLINITTPGEYMMGGRGTQYVLGAFEIGNALTGPYEYFSAWPPLALISSVTIDELTATTIRGRFFMTCVGSTGTVQLTNGSFNGTF